MSSPEARRPRMERAPDPAEGAALLQLAGELDLHVSGRFHMLVDDAMAGRPRLLVIDLTGVEFMDSTILRELLRADREAEAAGGRLVVAGVQPTVQRLLELTGTAEVLDLAGSRDEALASPG